MTVLGIEKRRLGLCFTKNEIVFALVEPDGHTVMRGRVPRTRRGRDALLDCHPPNLEIVLATARPTDPIVVLARSLGTPCWYVRSELVRTLRAASEIERAPLELTAALLACLPDATEAVIRAAPQCNLPLFPCSTSMDQHGTR